LWSTIQNLDAPLSWEDRRRFSLDTARGVNYIHTCSPPIIYRDIKSLNLLLDDSYKVKLADFGWTKGL
jgi:serine/threonine protein kinase